MRVVRGYLIPKLRETPDGRFEGTYVEIVEYERGEEEIKKILRVSGKNPREIADEISESIRQSEILLSLPADTRFPYFVSSLGCHLLTTASTAYCLCKIEGIPENQVQLVRLAALLHDLGKIRGIREHAKSTVEILRENGFFDFLREDARVLEDLILCHEKDSWKRELEAAGPERRMELQRLHTSIRILQEADQFSARLDRLSRLAGAEEFSLGEEELEARKPELEDRVKGLAERIDKRQPQPVVSRGPLALVAIDMRGLQAYIKQGGKLHDLRGGSDNVRKAHDEAIKASGLPTENFLIRNGGRLIFICPSTLVKEVAERMRKVIAQMGLETAVASVEFDSINPPDFGDLWTRLFVELQVAKFSRGEEEAEILWGHWKVCKACGRRIATVGDLCEMCNIKREEGRKRFTREFERLPPEYVEHLNRILDQLPEFMAGSCLRSLVEGKGSSILPNLSILVADGNLVGELFANCISFTQVMELCARLDRFCDTAERKILEMFKKTSELSGDFMDEFDEWRACLGRIFTEGDDILWLLPSWAAPFVALVLAREFYKEMGGKTSLSIGIVAMHPKASISRGLELAYHLMRNAKKAYREDRKNGRGTAAGYIDYEVCPTAEIPSPEVYVSGREMFCKFLARPLRLAEGSIGVGSSSTEDILDLIKALLEKDIPLHDPQLLKKVKEEVLGTGREKLKEKIKRMREVASFFRPEEELAWEKSLTYTVYQEARAEGEKKLLYQEVFNFLYGEPPKLLDALALARILEGGFG